MKIINIALLLSAVVLVGCQTTTKTTTKVATNDGIEVNANKLDKKLASEKYLALGMEYIRTGYLERAKDRLNKAEKYQPDSPGVQFGLAYYYQQVFEYEKADVYYKNAIKGAPDNADYMNAYGAFLCEGKEMYGEGVSYFLKAIDQPNYTSVGSTYENAGFCSMSDGRLDNAQTYFEKALTFNPNLTRSLYGLSKVALEKDNLRKAEAYLLKFESNSKPTSDSLLLGYYIGNAKNDERMRESYGKKLMQLFPNSRAADLYLNMK